MIPRTFEVTRRAQDNPVTFTLAAQAVEGPPLEFSPGQFNMLYVHGKGEIPISVSGPAHEPQQLIHTVQAVGAVSRAFTELEPGQRFGVRGPFGRGWPVEAARGHDVCLMAGGLGLAPLRPVIYAIAAQREHYGRVVVLYGARQADLLLFQAEFAQWPDIEVMVTVDVASPGWHGHIGVVTGLCRAASRRVDLSKAYAMVCGPPVMMRFSVRELLRWGAAPERVFLSVERNMQCGVGVCGHCQYGPYFLCQDGPVFAYPELQPWMEVREL